MENGARQMLCEAVGLQRVLAFEQQAADLESGNICGSKCQRNESRVCFLFKHQSLFSLFLNITFKFTVFGTQF